MLIIVPFTRRPKTMIDYRASGWGLKMNELAFL
jgi:hypothetical protein